MIKKTNINYLKKLVLGFFIYLPLLLTSLVPTFANNDLLNQAYDEAKRYDYIVNPGNDKNAVGAQVFNPTIDLSLNDNAGRGCFQGTTQVDIKKLFCESKNAIDISKIGCYNKKTLKKEDIDQEHCKGPLPLLYVDRKTDNCLSTNGLIPYNDDILKNHCNNVLNFDYDIRAINIEKKEPYLIRLTKLILRITIAISVSIIIFAGVSYILAFGDAGKQKKAQNIVIYALGGIFIGLASLAIVELALSITKSSLKI